MQRVFSEINVNVNSAPATARILFAVFLVLVLFGSSALAQKNEKVRSIEDLLRRPVKLKSELKNKHPRIFFTESDLTQLREKALGAGNKQWVEMAGSISLAERPPHPMDADLYKSGLDKRTKGSVTQYQMAFHISQTSFIHAVTRKDDYLRAAKDWTLAACDMPLWGYTYNKPNVDLPPAHLLYAVAFAYDVLYNDLTDAERTKIRNKLIVQGRLMYDYFKHKPNKRYSYSQNHTWIPIAGLAIASYALIDEFEEAKDWAALSRAVFDRTMQTFAHDGYFYESFHYFGFAFRWMIRYFDAHRSITGEDLYIPMQPKFENMKYFVMHSILPDRKFIFDFADTGSGALDRNGIPPRERLYGEHDILYRFASVYKDPEAQAVGEFIRTETNLPSRELMWGFINFDPTVSAAPISQIPTSFHFTDNDTYFWRSDWSTEATAAAFRSSPPEGHNAARLADRIPDWRQSTGHAHPDANSFILYAHGKYLTGDTGYLGIKQTDDHNTILINGKGQANDGVYDMFKEVSNDRLDKIRIEKVFDSAGHFYVKGNSAFAYDKSLGLSVFDRHLVYMDPGYFIVWDKLQTKTPSRFTFLLNADGTISNAGGFIDLKTGDVTLRTQRLSPEKADEKIVPQNVQARGLPGSVDKGEMEQRGLQLSVTSSGESKDFEFLHLLVPEKADLKNNPIIGTLLGGDKKAMRVALPDGSSDLVLFEGSGEQVVSDAGFVIVRTNDGNDITRLVINLATNVSFEANNLILSTAPVSADLTVGQNQKLSGTFKTESAAEIRLFGPFAGKCFNLNGTAITVDFDAATGAAKIRVPAGTSRIESI